MIDRLAQLAAELRERRAVRYLIAYAIAAWVVAQVVGFFVEQGYVGRVWLDGTLLLLLLGLLAALVAIWHHGEEGRQQTSRLEVAAYGVLAVAGVVGLLWLARTTPPDSAVIGDPLVDLGDTSVAVLPFDNDLTDPDLAWLDRGLSDLLATDLSQVPSLRVVSGQRVADLMRQVSDDGRVLPADMRAQVTRLAGARYLLSGRVAGQADDLVVVASLEDVRTGEISAAARERGADVFGMVDRVSSRLLDAVLGPEGSVTAPVADLTTGELDAYRLYQQGREAEQDVRVVEALANYDAALARDSTFALAHFHRAGLLAQRGRMTESLEGLRQARVYMSGATGRDRQFMEGLTRLMEGDFNAGMEQLEGVLDAYPDDKETRLILAQFKNGVGETEDAMRLVEGVIRLDPYYGPGYNQLAYFEAGRGNLDSALVLADRYAALQPGLANPHDTRGEVLDMAGRFSEAREAYRRALEVQPDFSPALNHLSRSYLRADEPAEGVRVLSELLESSDARVRARVHRRIADQHLWAGGFDSAFAAFDRSEEESTAAGETGLQVQALTGALYAAVELGRYAEAAELADRIGALERNPIAYTVQAVAYGERGQVTEVGRLADAFDREYRNDPSMAPFLSFVSGMYRAYEAFYRDEHERVVELASDAPRAIPGAGTEFVGFPVLRSLVALGDGARAASQLDVARAAGIKGPPVTFPFDPVHERLLQYFEGRAAELMGDSARAAASYGRLIDGWGDAARTVPLVADVFERHAALVGVPVPRDP